MIPPKDELTICFAHPAYNLQAFFERRETGIASFQVRTGDALAARISEADVVVVSGLWREAFLENARRLQFIQSVAAGTDMFDRDSLSARGIRLASARGVNSRAVSDHAMGLILALVRKLPEARDNQSRHVWRGMGKDLSEREDDLGDKTLLVVGLGAIGNRIAKLAKAFDMRVIGVRRDVSGGKGDADSVHALGELDALLPQADFVVLACPLTEATANIINERTLAAMKETAFLVNVARGGCVHEQALAAALKDGRIAGAAVDVAVDEPLAGISPLWDLPNLFITPHTGGETHRYEDNVLDILQENLKRLWAGEETLYNQVV
ncbi:D-2-hydroxyacid dehydrogenase [Microbaculum marinum]|uniref:D-2-hydroxyacid dehydrogenase n=1 Tax=Microbaculum marinum TaxID=1764581 RepID=A0AAW9RSP6_9HYPH